MSLNKTFPSFLPFLPYAIITNEGIQSVEISRRDGHNQFVCKNIFAYLAHDSFHQLDPLYLERKHNVVLVSGEETQCCIFISKGNTMLYFYLETKHNVVFLSGNEITPIIMMIMIMMMMIIK